jgi:hypothetical protein
LFISNLDSGGIEISHWPELMRLRKVTLGIELIYNELQIKETVVKFSDIFNSNYGITFGLLEHIFRSRDSSNDILPGFVYTPEGVQLDWEKAILNCPIIVTIPEGTLILNIEIIGKVAFAKNDKQKHPVGLRFTKMVSCEIENNNNLTEPTDAPIMVLNDTMALKFSKSGCQSIKSPLKISIAFSLFKPK